MGVPESCSITVLAIINLNSNKNQNTIVSRDCNRHVVVQRRLELRLDSIGAEGAAILKFWRWRLLSHAYPTGH